MRHSTSQINSLKDRRILGTCLGRLLVVGLLAATVLVIGGCKGEKTAAAKASASSGPSANASPNSPSSAPAAANSGQAKTERITSKGSSYVISIKKVAPKTTLIMQATVAPDKIAPRLKSIFKAVLAHLTKQNLKPAGDPFMMITSLPRQGFSSVNLEAGYPVKAGATGAGGIRVSKRPGGKVATTSYTGSPQGLRKVHDALHRWMKRKKIKPSGKLWEIYSNASDSKLTAKIFYAVE